MKQPVEAQADRPIADARSRLRRPGIRGKLLLLLFISSLASSAIYTVFAYWRERATIEAGIDARLLAGAQATVLIAGGRYHDDIRGSDSVSPERYDEILIKLTQYAKAAGLQYVYTYMQSGDRIVTTSSNATDAELRTGTYDRFYHHYDTAAPSLYRAFRTREIVYENLSDSYGSFRTVSVPIVTPGGRVFVAGADIGIDFVDDQLHRALRSALLIGIAIFLVMFVAGHIMVSRIVRPLTALTVHTADLVGASVHSRVAHDIRRIASARRDEVGALATALAHLIERMENYMRELEASTAARERVEGELAAAREIQMGLLPWRQPPFPHHGEFDLHGLMEPAKAVGGDLYDYFVLAQRYLVFIVGDVAGKGVPAALFMTVAKTLFKGNSIAAATADPPDVEALITLLNRQLCDENPQDLFVTVFAGVLDIQTGIIRYCDAGHDAPIILSSAGSVRRLDKIVGVPLGAIEDYRYVGQSFALQPGETLLLFTDGVTEAMNDAGIPLSFDRLLDLLATMPATLAPAELNGRVRDSVRAYAKDAEQSDDLTLLSIRYIGPQQVEVARR